MAKKNVIGLVIDRCNWCGETNFPLTKYKKEWLCDHCLARRKLIEPAKKKIKQHEKEKATWDELRLLP